MLFRSWENEEFQELLKASRTELDSDKRIEILKEAEQIFMDQMPIVPIYFYSNVYAYKDNVKNIEVGPLGVIQYKWGYIAAE